jgi:hypothetical protein
MGRLQIAVRHESGLSSSVLSDATGRLELRFDRTGCG